MNHVPEKQRGAGKLDLEPSFKPPVSSKPSWIRGKSGGVLEVKRLSKILRENRLHTVCEEAACPNIGECFNHGTATLMIMGDICTRQCPFCAVAHGPPQPLDAKEPESLADLIWAMGLKYVVITSVTRDDLADGGVGHFVSCIGAIRRRSPDIKVEILVPDFQGSKDLALDTLGKVPPDVFNHNLEAVPSLYRKVRPEADYRGSLQLLHRFKQRHPKVPTKSGLMLGLGETIEEVRKVMKDLRDHSCEMLTLGQYLRPSRNHLPVARYVNPQEFDQLRDIGMEMGFSHVASGPMVRSSYHADMQARDLCL